MTFDEPDNPVGTANTSGVVTMMLSAPDMALRKPCSIRRRLDQDVIEVLLQCFASSTICSGRMASFSRVWAAGNRLNHPFVSNEAAGLPGLRPTNRTRCGFQAHHHVQFAGRCPSIKTTLRPSRAKPVPRLAVVVVFPTPLSRS